ncbi:MAG: hypothetical protein IKA86_05930 [Paraprevotella sp.]|nr:hypothetical protein [Paraprevotella sp.]MBR2380511.1 hypothetical protein [Paraprevotella sp.]
MAANKERMIRCLECKHGRFMQWMNNPIICECAITNERQVAEAYKLCNLFNENYSQEAPSITHYDSY